MDLGLRGRTAIVSGASAGLGLATAEALAGEGANVTMFGISVTGITTVAPAFCVFARSASMSGFSM